MVQQSDYTLSSLLPTTTLLLIYALPLLFLSLILNFSGAFLTLDRSRSFAPTYDGLNSTSKQKKHWALEGGIGGLASGYLCGLHLSTFLALLIPSSTRYSRLGSTSFLAIWLLSAAVLAVLGGRWRYAALVFSGLSGGASFSLALSVIVHPSLLTRRVFLGVFVVLFSVAVLVPHPRTRHPSLRTATAATGAFGTILAIALLARIPSWSNVWERLWLRDGATWGTSQEKGLCAAWAFFLAAGVTSDYFLRKRFGECPDEQWDTYLSTMTNNANLPGRPGTFQPFPSFWDRVFKRTAVRNSVFPNDTTSLFPNDTNAKRDPHDHQRYYQHDIPLPLSPLKSRPFAKTTGAVGGPRKKPVKFLPGSEIDKSGDSDYSDDDDDDEGHPNNPFSDINGRKHRRSIPSSSSTPTLIDGVAQRRLDPFQKEGAFVQDPKGGLDYDNEDPDEMGDLGKGTSSSPEDDHAKGWKPGFLKRHSISRTTTTSDSATAVPSSVVTPPIPGAAVAVPVTPSLLNAIDRISKAQQEAFNSPEHLQQDKRGEEGHGAQKPWDHFWKDVQRKRAG